MIEVVCCFEEKVVIDVCDVDVGVIMGWGFVFYIGGLILFIDIVGIKKFVEECDRFV